MGHKSGSWKLLPAPPPLKFLSRPILVEYRWHLNEMSLFTSTGTGTSSTDCFPLQTLAMCPPGGKSPLTPTCFSRNATQRSRCSREVFDGQSSAAVWASSLPIGAEPRSCTRRDETKRHRGEALASAAGQRLQRGAQLTDHATRPPPPHAKRLIGKGYSWRSRLPDRLDVTCSLNLHLLMRRSFITLELPSLHCLSLPPYSPSVNLGNSGLPSSHDRQIQ